MGWSFGYNSKQELVDKCKSPEFYSEGYTPLDSRTVGNHIWVLLETPEGKKTVAVNRIRHGARDGWGYKGESASMGPSTVNCPLSLLDMADEPLNEWDAAWREKVRQYHAAKKARPKYAKGQIWELGGKHYRLQEPAGKRRGWLAVQVENGELYRMPASYLGKATYTGTE